MTVLIADDDGDQLALRSMLLESKGFETLQAKDAPTALRMAASARPDCAVVDLALPSAEAGLRLIRDLKQLDKEIRVFVLTGAPRRFMNAPEYALVEEVLTKGNCSAELVRKLQSCGTRRAGIGLDRIAEILHSKGTVTVSVKVIPRASRSEVLGMEGDALKVKVAATPEKGKANEELREALAAHFRIPKTRVEILSGESSAHKRVRLSG